MQQLTFEAQYLGTVSFVTATLLGNTFGWTFAKQQQLVAQLSEEVFAIELLVQELFIEIPEPHLRWRVIQHIKCALGGPSYPRMRSPALPLQCLAMKLLNCV